MGIARLEWSLKSWELMPRQVVRIWQVINKADCVCLKFSNPSWEPREHVQKKMSCSKHAHAHMHPHTHTCILGIYKTLNAISFPLQGIRFFLHRIQKNYLCFERILQKCFEETAFAQSDHSLQHSLWKKVLETDQQGRSIHERRLHCEGRWFRM